MNDQINEITNNSSTNPILDIVTSIQSKLNENNSNNLNNANINSSNESNKIDLSGLDISKMLEGLTGATTKNNFNAPTTNNNSGFNLDLNTIMNFQKVISGVNQTDPRRDLLTSLKPFLRETRQKNIDTYITLLGVMKAFNIFTNKDRD